ncbi:terminase [Mycobacteroides chelonae]|uniref:terminase n=1 Tax=Mycobacteroides chelonae TaxID=1774 RepID=UPI0008A97297|nr:terminase [Mycobacteroides chelonae]OHU23408.1 terminase [Mycobacteroides chelonae]
MTLSTTLSTPRLSEVARHLVIPEGIETSVFPRVYRRLNEVGVYFDPWQQGMGTVALGCRHDGKYAATVGGVVCSICRQSGKTYTFGSLYIGLCLEFPGYQAIWTSHHTRTTTKTFQSLQGIVRRPKIYPLLDHSSRSDGIRSTNGEQEIRFENGSVIMFGAREQGFGRGMDGIDAEVFDEAQILSIKALEDMVPATNQSKHQHGGLIFYLGTPPRPTDDGEAFAMKRERAIKDKPEGQVVLVRGNQVYIELSAEKDANPDDESQWPKMNPSYPHRTPHESMLRMRENLPDEDSWRREAMGIWPEHSHHVPIVTPAQWKTLYASGPELSLAPNGIGVDMSHGGDISVNGCWIRGEDAHVEEIWAGRDVAAAIDWIAAAAGKRIEIVIDDLSPAAQMIPELKARGCKVRRGTARDMAKGCLLFETRANASTLTHAGQKTLTNAVMGGRKRLISDAGGWGWDRKDSTVVIHQAVGATLALFGASEKHNPKRGKRQPRKAVTG